MGEQFAADCQHSQQVASFPALSESHRSDAFAVATGFALTGTLASAPAIGLSLPGVYFIWLLVLVLLYPICRWVSDLKAGGRGWWWSYL